MRQLIIRALKRALTWGVMKIKVTNKYDEILGSVQNIIEIKNEHFLNVDFKAVKGKMIKDVTLNEAGNLIFDVE